jgi:hypothetical protein
VSNLHHEHDQFSIANRVQDPILSVTDAVPVPAGELLATGRAGIIGQRSDPGDNPLPKFFLGDSLKLSKRRWLDFEAISCH